MTAWVRWFAQPWALWLLLALPVVSLLFAWANWRRRRALAQLGAPFLVERLIQLRPRLRRWQSFALYLGLLGLIFAAAGPRWGVSAQPELLGGRDLVVVLDLSKSMLAEQPSRLERARRSLRDLADGLEARGGHRVALVVFAAHAKLQFPLTGDYDHFRHVIEQLDAEEMPPAVRPQPGAKIASGTRLGEALSLAVSAQTSEVFKTSEVLKRDGWQDIILLSDGDDPAGDDEWARGVQAARRRQIPIHVVAVGDPREAHPIRIDNEILRHAGVVIQSKLNEALLQEIARRTQGIYFPAHLTALPLGRLLRGHLENRPDAPGNEDEQAAAPIQTELRYAWFLLPAFVLLGITMLCGDGPDCRFLIFDCRVTNLRARGLSVQIDNRQSTIETAQAASLPRWTIIALLPFLISAEPLASIDETVRQGNAAFARQQYDEALQSYAKAAELARDPGLIAFNQAAALYRLGRYDEAAAHYQRCLDDQAIPPARLARASYDLGTALIQAGSDDRGRLEQAIAALRRCLDSDFRNLEDVGSLDLQADARYNLELAKWLWLRAKPAQTTEQPNSPDQTPDKPSVGDPDGNADAKKNAAAIPGMADGGPDKNGIDHPGLNARKKKLAHGPLQALPDNDKLSPLSPEETDAHLERFLERMRRERRGFWRQLAPAPPDLKDW